MKKNEKIQGMLILAVLCSLFVIGNRLGMLFLKFNNGDNPVMVPVKAIDEFMPSFKNENLGLKISFEFIPILIGLLLITVAVAMYLFKLDKRKNTRPGEEHGSARYATLEEGAELKDETNEDYNAILSKHLQLNLNTRKTFLNDNIVLIGGSGSGKTRFFVKPNVLQMNTNFVITDPKGNLIKEIGKALDEQGNYEIKILNLIDMDMSMKYNPFVYIFKPSDVLKFINSLVTNTTDKQKTGGDDFFVKAEIALLTALVYLILGTANDENQNMRSLMELIDLADASEEDENAQSVLDVIFEQLNEELEVMLQSEDRRVVLACKNSYEYLACKQYSLYKKAAGKTAKSILISVGVRMAVFNIPELDELLSTDEMNLQTIGNPMVLEGNEHLSDNDPNKYKKTATFIIVSDSDTTFNFIASIFYQQAFDLLYSIADSRKGSKLPIHTRFILDEFANIGQIPDFAIKIATMRSREISVNVILQNLAQLKNLYKEQWETIIGNCDTTVFLGGKEYSTLESISKWIGNTTINFLSINETKGSNRSYSKSYQLISRALLPPDEIGRLKPKECLIHIRGKHIFKDEKYPLENHENVEYTMDAKSKARGFDNEYFYEEEIEEHRNNHGYIMPAYINKRKTSLARNINVIDVTGTDIDMLADEQ